MNDNEKLGFALLAGAVLVGWLYYESKSKLKPKEQRTVTTTGIFEPLLGDHYETPNGTRNEIKEMEQMRLYLGGAGVAQMAYHADEMRYEFTDPSKLGRKAFLEKLLNSYYFSDVDGRMHHPDGTLVDIDSIAERAKINEILLSLPYMY